MYHMKFLHTNLDTVKNQAYKSQILEIIVSNLEVGVYVSDYYTGEIIFVNQKTADLLNHKMDINDLVGKTCWNVLGGYPGRCEFCSYEKLIDENGEPIGSYAWEHYFEDYGFWGKVINQAAKWTDGHLVQITLFYDITDTKKMQQLISERVRIDEQLKMRQNLQILLDSLPLPIRIVDIKTAGITYVNQKFLETFEYNTPEALVNRHVSILFPHNTNDKESFRKHMYEISRADSNHSSELEYITSSGKIFYGLLTSCVIDYNGRKSSVGIIVDLTAEKEQKLLLMQAAEREREANQLKSSFLSNMSHEIRTPMNAIIGLTEIELRKKHQGETVKVYSKINTSAKNLLQIINDILDLSKIEANKVELFPVEFELEEVLNSVLLVVAPRLEGKPLELLLNLSLDMPKMLVGDKTRLWQILRNILDNAAKFTAAGSVVLAVSESNETEINEIVTKKDLPEDTIWISFSIADTGVGMNEEQARRVFLPYEQIYDNLNVHRTGTGLGLPIAKQLCELMGGGMTVESEPGHGTTMKFTIPFTRSQNPEIEFQALNAKGLAELKILIVDDNKLAIHATENLLHSCGIETCAACSGEEALEIVCRQSGEPPFDIILLDYIMNGMDGLECAKLMRLHLPVSTKILILTAYENLIDKSVLQSHGIDDVIEKPFAPTYFIQKLVSVSDKVIDLGDGGAQELCKFSNARVLVCEDNEINQEIVITMLEQFGVVNTVVADNGKMGVEILENDRLFDLILMDLHMPIMDGYTATKFIRSVSKFDDLPIISLTADAMVETLNECLSIGINDVITKPVSFEDIERILLKWLPESKRRL